MLASRDKRWFTDQLAEVLGRIGRETPSPGTVVPDFEAHVSYFRARSVRPTGKTNLLPLAVAGDLNERLTRPVRHGLERPVLKSLPHVGGLFMLARASGMIQIGSCDGKPVFEVHEGLWSRWQALNLSERYCSLLETWVLRGTLEILGERDNYGGPYGSIMLSWIQFFQRIPSGGMVMGEHEEFEILLRYFPGRYNLALLELFGLIDVEHLPPAEGEGWRVARIAPAPPGAALVALLYDWVMGNLDRILDHAEEGTPISDTLQPLLQPYFPDCRRNLGKPAEEPAQEGTFVFRVSLGSIWCRIAMPVTLTLFHFAKEIIDWIGFDHDHFFEFRYLDRFGIPTRAADSFWIDHDNGIGSFWDETQRAHKVMIGELPLQPGTKMTLIYDFGDYWEFNIKLEAIDPDDRRQDVELLEAHGEPPEQYGIWGYEDYDWDE